ncbi:protein takeout-like [Euwallacea fornicatus]|uniref:protein takeout-like n=1 Tax=Euwallacea fornicatus TaxID=995702 RepID=UPI00338FDD69
MFYFALVSVLICLCLNDGADAAKLPSSWTKCNRTVKTFPECFRKGIEYAINSFNKPTPELELGSLEPLDIPSLDIGEGRGAVNVAQHFKNVKLHGLTNVKIYRSMIDWDKKTIITDSLSPSLRLEGEYAMNGRVLLLPVMGQGTCNITLENMKIHHVMSFDYVERKGKTYMKVTDIAISMNLEKISFKFHNLFNRQRGLGENINNVLNDNSADVFNDVREGYEKSFGLIFKNLANSILLKVPVEDLFLN